MIIMESSQTQLNLWTPKTKTLYTSDEYDIDKYIVKTFGLDLLGLVFISGMEIITTDMWITTSNLVETVLCS